MAELTLESLAARVEALEKLVQGAHTITRGGHVFVVLPGTGDWASAFEAVNGLTDYDFGANADINDLELRIARGE